jgi:hypothetical protein
MTLGPRFMEPLSLSLDEVLEIHEQQIERYGGSAANSCTPRFQLWRQPTSFISARTTRSSMATRGQEQTPRFAFLLLNDWEPGFTEEELVDLVLSVASGRLKKPELVEIFESRCTPLEAS